VTGPAEVITAVPTPFTESGDLDLVAARELFGFVARTTGRMFVAGTTGEFPALTDAERLSLIKTALDVAGTRRVLAHVGAADAHRARLLTEAAVALGATRLAAITPYFLAAGPAEVADYFEQVAKAAPGCEVYAYLFPERTGVTVRPRQLARMASRAGLAGVKLSGSAADGLAGFVRAAPAGFRVYSGNDRDLDSVAAKGGAGVVSGVSAALPELFVRRADVTAAVDLLGPSIGRLKYALSLRGLIGTASRMTVGAPGPGTRRQIAALIGELT
jgi:4-hydroxy-tetrahydrodipicolinate synthase